MSPAGLRRYRAERLLRKDFAGLRAKVLAVVRAQLRAKGIALDPADLEACYAQAWHGLYASVLEGEQIESPSAWLVLVTFRRAIDESRAASRTGVVGVGDLGSYPQQLDAGALDMASELDDRTRLRHVFEAMRATLSERECEAASLCYLQGLSRADAAERMGVSEARMRKLMEGAGPGRPGVAAKVGELLDTIKAGGWCERQSSLMRAYAFGILDPAGERYALAVAHCNECPACRAHVASLRGLASVLPLPLLPQLGFAGGGAKAGAGAASKASGGLSGSLTAKLAVTAVVLLGAGYGFVESRAHGSTPTHRAISPPVAASRPLVRALRVSRSVHVHEHHSHRRTSPVQAHSARKARSTGESSDYEFGPERVGSSPAVPAPSPATPSPPVVPGNEFGIE
jgi:DNA-directed RNA polymerase specialized sigma24 family protein